MQKHWTHSWKMQTIARKDSLFEFHEQRKSPYGILIFNIIICIYIQSVVIISISKLWIMNKYHNVMGKNYPWTFHIFACHSNLADIMTIQVLHMFSLRKVLMFSLHYLIIFHSSAFLIRQIRSIFLTMSLLSPCYFTTVVPLIKIIRFYYCKYQENNSKSRF